MLAMRSVCATKSAMRERQLFVKNVKALRFLRKSLALGWGSDLILLKELRVAPSAKLMATHYYIYEL